MSECVLSFPATLDRYALAAAELRRALQARAVPDLPRYRAELVFEEIVSNVIRHGACADGPCAIDVRVSFARDELIMCFRDNGRAVDPRAQALPQLPRSPEQGEHGGLGLLLVAKAAGRIEYQRTREEKNELTIAIELARHAAPAV